MLGAIRSMTKEWENKQAIFPLDTLLVVLKGSTEHLEKKSQPRSANVWHAV